MIKEREIWEEIYKNLVEAIKISEIESIKKNFNLGDSINDLTFVFNIVESYGLNHF